jgi:magnesium-transporting ATPase (P-type)
VTLGFIAAVKPAEEGSMEKPPHRVGKRLIRRFLLLHIIIGTIVLVATTVGSVFWTKADGYSLFEQHSQALNTLSFGAITITLSARFSYNSSIHHPPVFRGNVLCWYAIFILAGLQFVITYTPTVNSTIFEMALMDAWQWVIVAMFTAVTFIVMEIKKAV